jgi:BMFP domain-containing protein YqiC
MENQVITIPLETSMDPSTLLDIAMQLAERLKDEIESYGEEVEYDEGDICVSYSD